MNETEWLECTDPGKMLEVLGDRASERKLRLLACAHCRRQMLDPLDPLDWAMVEVAERFADGEATWDDLSAARKAAKKPPLFPGARRGESRAAEWVAARWQAGHAITWAPPWRGKPVPEYAARHAAYKVQGAHLLREVFGNPFRPAILDPAWLAWNGGAVRKVSQAIYDERRFAALPILADALEDAGCADTEVLTHCRGPGEHMRGCWVLDLLLGKA
jgi:hypothetical protein